MPGTARNVTAIRELAPRQLTAAEESWRTPRQLLYLDWGKKQKPISRACLGDKGAPRPAKTGRFCFPCDAGLSVSAWSHTPSPNQESRNDRGSVTDAAKANR